MKMSNLFYYSEKNFPKDAEVLSDRLLRKSNILAKAAAGSFYYTPILLKSLRKLEEIVRKEMNRAGAQEILLPVLLKKELWEESGRWERYTRDQILFHLTNRRNVEMCLAPTHEEAVTDLVRRFVSSYKQLPLNLYQINTKFRDEIRPRFGLMRASEFIMKDAYSFDYSEGGLDKSYRAMRKAYQNICEKLGLDYLIVNADSGAIGGSASEEFMVTAEYGEDNILYCTNCGYAANSENAVSVAEAETMQDYNSEMIELLTPDIKSVEELVKHTGIAHHQMIKTIIYKLTFADCEKFTAILMRGDLEINEIKLQNHFGCLALQLASEAEIRDLTGAEVGFAGPFNLNTKIELIADLSVLEVKYFLCGLNKTDYHNINVCFGWDIELPKTVIDLRLAKKDELCACCHKERLSEKQGIEIGHIFKLGDKYSEKMKLSVDCGGVNKPVQMGCYGIGITRLLAAAIEQNSTEEGIVWPNSLAPYQVVVIAAGKDELSRSKAEEIYQYLLENDVEVLYDDRDAGTGYKFKDADLIGIPFRIVVGKRAVDGIVEFSKLGSRDKDEINISELDKIVENLK